MAEGRLTLNYKKLQNVFVIAIIIASIGVVAFIFLSWYLKATLEVFVPDGASVSVYSADLKNELISSTDKPGNHKFRLPRGTYTVMLAKGFSASKTTLTMGLRDYHSVKLELSELDNVLKISDLGSNSVGVVNGNPAYLNPELFDIRNASGKKIAGSEFLKPRDVVFASNNTTQLVIDNMGYGFILREGRTLSVFSEGGDVQSQLGPKKDIQDFGSITAAAYDETSNKFCILTSLRNLAWVTLDSGRIEEIVKLDNSELADTIDCDNNRVAYSQLNRDFDGHTSLAEDKVNITILSEASDKKTISAHGVSAFGLVNNKDQVAYISDGLVYVGEYESGINKAVHSTINTSSSAISLNGGDMYVFDKSDIWKSTGDYSTFTRVAAHPDLLSVSSVAFISDSIVFAVEREVNKGIYMTTSNEVLHEEYTRLTGRLPYMGINFTVRYYFDGKKVVVESTNLAPIPSSGDMDQYNTTDTAAKDFVTSLNLNKDLVRTVFK